VRQNDHIFLATVGFFRSFTMARRGLFAALTLLFLQRRCVAADEPDVCSVKETIANNDCAFYIAESSIEAGKLGLYSGIRIAPYKSVATWDAVLPIIDANKNEYSPWHDLAQPVDSTTPFESAFLSHSMILGVGAVLACSDAFYNVVQIPTSSDTNTTGQSTTKFTANVHRAHDPEAGAYSRSLTYRYVTTRSIRAGEEFIRPCDEEEPSTSPVSGRRKVMDLTFLHETGVCLQDSITVQPSTRPKAGRGAFAKHAITTNQVIGSSPVIHMDRSQVEIVEQQLYDADDTILPLDSLREHGIKYTAERIGLQLLLNYCFGHSDSNVLLLPFAPGVNYINHSKEKANARIRWLPKKDQPGSGVFMKTQPAMELFSIPVNNETLTIEYVALTDIAEGDEIFLDYGDAWSNAWADHVSNWKPVDGAENYVYSSDFVKMYGDKSIRTLDEQITNPYPPNLQTACIFHLSDDDITADFIEWSDEEHNDCLRPCHVLDREVSETDNETYYSVIVEPILNVEVPSQCGFIPDDGLSVVDIPSQKIHIVDKQYASDLHLSNAFRHEIGLPDGFLPSVWASADPMPMGEFVLESLQPGQLGNVKWKDSGKVVTPNALRLGLSDQLRSVLLDYCNKTGITDILKHVTLEGNSLTPGQDVYLKVNGMDWYLQRPNKSWNSNLHWLSPADHPAHEDYLQALSAAGFDDMLREIGKQLKFDGLVAFHVTFIAVSRATRGYLHKDVAETDAKTYNVIVPLILAEDTGPELDIQQWPPNKQGIMPVGRMRYDYNSASLQGGTYMNRQLVDRERVQ
jgi:hypothetical protein